MLIVVGNGGYEERRSAFGRGFDSRQVHHTGLTGFDGRSETGPTAREATDVIGATQ